MGRISTCKPFSALKRLLCCPCRAAMGCCRVQDLHAEKRIGKKTRRCEMQPKAVSGAALLGDGAGVDGSLIHESTAGSCHI